MVIRLILRVSVTRQKVSSLLVLLGYHKLQLNAVHVSYVTDGVPLFIIHEVNYLILSYTMLLHWYQV